MGTAFRGLPVLHQKSQAVCGSLSESDRANLIGDRDASAALHAWGDRVYHRSFHTVFSIHQKTCQETNVRLQRRRRKPGPIGDQGADDATTAESLAE